MQLDNQALCTKLRKSSVEHQGNSPKEIRFKKHSTPDRFASFVGGMLTIAIFQGLLWLYIGEHKPKDSLFNNVLIGLVLVVIPSLFFTYWGMIRLCEALYGEKWS